MRTIYLISTTLLKENSVVCNNVDDTLLTTGIMEAQEIELQQTLGSKLYKKIITLVDTGDIDIEANSDYKVLLDDYCQKVVVYYSVFHAIPSMAIKLKNKGAVREYSENSQDAQFNEFEYLRKDIENKAQFFNQRLADYLHQNRGKFPEYTEPAGCDEIKPNRSSYRSALVLDEPSCPKAGLGYNFRTITL